jgi:hypothetical protein
VAAASPASGTAASGTSGIPGPLGWLLLLVAAVVLGGVLVIRRSRRHTGWAADIDTLTVDARAVIGIRLPSVLGRHAHQLRMVPGRGTASSIATC